MIFAHTPLPKNGQCPFEQATFPKGASLPCNIHSFLKSIHVQEKGIKWKSPKDQFKPKLHVEKNPNLVEDRAVLNILYMSNYQTKSSCINSSPFINKAIVGIRICNTSKNLEETLDPEEREPTISEVVRAQFKGDFCSFIHSCLISCSGKILDWVYF